MAYEVRLEVFEGPFDLLLQLIARRKLEVVDVDLADITADFLQHLGDLEHLDLETATRFLVVAATLIELKAVRLLPVDERAEVEDLLAEERDLLYARLLEYRAFRELADRIGTMLLGSEAFLPREVTPEPRFRALVPPTPLGVDGAGLARLAAAALAPPPIEQVDLAHVRRATISIREAAGRLLDRVREAAGTFAELTEGRERHERVVWFLAALELYKLGHLDLDQPDLAGPLHVGPGSGPSGAGLSDLEATSAGDEVAGGTDGTAHDDATAPGAHDDVAAEVGGVAVATGRED